MSAASSSPSAAETYFGARGGDGADCLFHHGLPLKGVASELSDHLFAPIKVTRNDLGLFAETVLNLADEYEAAVKDLIDKGKLGWSSGAPPHMVKKTEDGIITRWPIIEGSFTPKPAEPRNRVLSLKTYQAELEDAPAVKAWDVTENELRWRVREPEEFDQDSFRYVDLKEDKPRVRAVMGKLKGGDSMVIQAVRFPKDEWTKADAKRWLDDHPDVLKKGKSVKGLLRDKLEAQTPSWWQFQNVFSDVAKDIALAARSERVTGVGVDIPAKVREALAEYTELVLPAVVSQIEEFAGSQDEHFYLKSKSEAAPELAFAHYAFSAVKAGRRNSAKDLELLNHILRMVKDLGATEEKEEGEQPDPISDFLSRSRHQIAGLELATL